MRVSSSKALIIGTIILLTLLPISVIDYRLRVNFNERYYVYMDRNILVTWAPGGPPRLKIDVVDKTGKPIKFSALIAAPALNGFRNIGRVRGEGSSVIDLTDYILELGRLVKKLGWRPNEVQVSILAIIMSSKIGDNGTIEFQSMFTSIALPATFRNGTINAKIIYNPTFTYKVKVKNSNINATSLNAITLAQTAPPEKFNENCVFYDEYLGIWDCYYWELNETIYVGEQNVPLHISYLSEIDSKHIMDVMHLTAIELAKYTNEYVSFKMSLGITAPSYGTLLEIEVPGPGFTLTLGSEERRMYFYLSCYFHSNTDSECYYGEPPSTLFYLTRFSSESIIASGFKGLVYAVKYSYVHEYSDLDRRGKEILNESIALWFAPYAKKVGGIDYIEAYVEIDNNPYDNRGTLEGLIKLILNSYKEKLYAYRVVKTYEVTVADLLEITGSTHEYMVGLPVGALIALALGQPELVPLLLPLSIGIGLESQDTTFYSKLFKQAFDSNDRIEYAASYYELPDPYLVVSSNSYIRVPLLVVRPGATAVEITYAGGAGSGAWSLNANDEGGTVKLYAESFGEDSGPIPYQAVLNTSSTTVSESSVVVEYVIKPNWPTDEYYYLIKVNYTIDAAYNEYAKFAVKAKIVDPEGFIIDETSSEHPLYSGAGGVSLNGTLYLRVDDDYRGEELLLIIEFKAAAWYNEDLYALADAYSGGYRVNYALKVEAVSRYAGTKPY